MPLYQVAIEATGLVTVDDPSDPQSAVDGYFVSPEQAQAYSLERLRKGAFPPKVLAVLETHVGAAPDDVQDDEAKVFVSISFLVDIEDADDFDDFDASDDGWPELLGDITTRMGVDFDHDGFELLSADEFEGYPPGSDPELVALTQPSGPKPSPT